MLILHRYFNMTMQSLQVSFNMTRVVFFSSLIHQSLFLGELLLEWLKLNGDTTTSSKQESRQTIETSFYTKVTEDVHDRTLETVNFQREKKWFMIDGESMCYFRISDRVFQRRTPIHRSVEMIIEINHRSNFRLVHQMMKSYLIHRHFCQISSSKLKNNRNLSSCHFHSKFQSNDESTMISANI